ncbi:MAG TPA: hypothetical protein PLB30_09270 [Thermoleophilia bacterium]|nr:hypothetical protein [Thermoleophilia bacterium]HQG03501.1 hypothetical protein [Thermoleophilia bacterium]HQG54956.1 hypothetical protein [Thermoleophilia bacterium]HQJ98713.1 hypothetical protein [Thermoleophilia bacterium]
MLHGDIHRDLPMLSVANWVLAIVCWSVSAYLGMAVPSSIIVCAVLFVVGLFAVVVALAAYVVPDFGVAPAAGSDAGANAPIEAPTADVRTVGPDAT